METSLTAALIIIGDEVLSGRTRDSHLQMIAEFLAPYGIDLVEARILPDQPTTIVDAVNTLRRTCTYVFTTGGIGPTHDDKTADAIAAAFDRPISEREDALDCLRQHYLPRGLELNDARRRMARIPEGASLIANPVSGAPGFQTENVFTLAGVPSIARAMLDDIGHRLKSGAIVQSVSVRLDGAKEGALAAWLEEAAAGVPETSVGCYPWFDAQGGGTVLVARGRNLSELESIKILFAKKVDANAKEMRNADV